MVVPGGGPVAGGGGIDQETRRQLVLLARRSQSRSATFSRARPTDWRPSDVRDPAGWFPYFTGPTAWEFIASRLEGGEEVEVVELHQPPGARGYVMKIDVGADVPSLYVKLELRAGKIIGRSFHYSEYH